MIRVYDILENIEIQCDVRFLVYDSDAETVIELTEEKARAREVKYMWCEDDVLVLEVCKDE